ncbi:MAG: protein translocase subunit SecD [Anaerolineae bacterium]|nr:protein translocase subunit SecD [Anaerolineae bacterium]MDW7990975.1 protein translocase subunit SecD [Anaerolineae bacterium]
MEKRDRILLVVIALLALFAIYVDLDIQHPRWLENLLFWQPEGARKIAIRYGLDLRGGLRVSLVADVPEGQEVDRASLETARQIVENRVNGLGLAETLVQIQGGRRIIVELPGIEQPEVAIEIIRGTALLEFVDAGYTFIPKGTIITTTLGGPHPTGIEALTTPIAPPTPTAPVTPTAGVTETTPTVPVTPTAEVTSTVPATPTLPPGVYQTILTGADLDQVGLDRDEMGYYIPFRLKAEAAEKFAQYTASHVNQYLCIVLDKRVLSCPVIEEAIPGGTGRITLGNATYQEARGLAIQLHYGALPVPLRVETATTVGPTLGEISVQKSVRAGIVGLSVVLLFMLVYYRILGGTADLALLLYAALNLALYKLVPVTLTLPGIAGFLLSTGMAVDANILVFERMKEELRAGRSLRAALEAGFSRAWTSIRDSQISILIACAVLYFFGTNFGASMVKGFALTLAIGTTINLFTAIVVTRTFLRVLFRLAGPALSARRWLLGV